MDTFSAQDIVDTVPSSLLVLDMDLTVHSANRAFYRTFQAEPEATVGRPLFELGTGQWDIPDLRRLLVEVVPRDGTVEGYEVGHDFPGIGVKCMRLNARKVFRPGNGIPFLLLAIDDVTAEHEARGDAERQDRLATSIVDTVRDPMVVLEGDMTVAQASCSFVRLFGDEGGDLVGRSLYDLAQGKWRVGRLQELLARVVPDDTALDGFEVEDEFPGLGRRIFRLNARKVFRPGNHVTRLLLVFEDVTEARLLERHRDLLAAELAHRIKNSLQIITSFVSYEIRRAAEPCIAGYKAMQARIGAVAGLYDVISRSASLGPVPVGPYLEGIAGSLRSSLLGTDTGVAVAVEAEPLFIVSDHAVTIGLIVNELATNAVKYAFPNGRGRILLGFARRDGDVVLTVADDGVGLAATSGSNPASGKGSRFVEAFVRQVGGTLATASGRTGTTYTVRLPISILAEP
ncbi:PAS domain-containing protein [Methylobacterium sp. E-005]|uniref:sensor histidine kinase n=1 Tax=Methylobacterium sp. E-005 TaxID=2836549 RepID=UPI001FBAB303|nr:PAS domain-containing protein [Methylobacterium sp. E-005]MCJ2088028.1 PAS domain-containing protein [Methylobacterium sp. E-005]